jgi:ketosteroid isomerase-like protein
VTTDNLAIVKDAYARFGAGDAQGLLALLDADVRWEVVGEAGAYPTFGVWRGRQKVGEFLATLAELEAIDSFTPRDFHSSGQTVIVFGHVGGVVRATGRRVESEWAHEFTLADGLITGFREFFDTAQFVAAARG